MTAPNESPERTTNSHHATDASAPLHARIAQLEAEVEHMQQLRVAERERAEETAQIYEETVTNMLTGILVMQLERPGDQTSLRLIAANPAASRFSGVDLAALIGRFIIDVFPTAIEHQLASVYMLLATDGGLRELGEVEYADELVSAGFFSVRAFGLPKNRVCIAFESITERKRAEEALRQSLIQDEVIRLQAAALAELSTPLIPLNDDVVVMPIIGTVDSRRAQQVLETLLTGIGGSGAQVAILDITGVSVVDTQVANVFISAAQAVKLLGAQVVLTGIRPEVAQTLIGLGVDLNGIVTHSSLQRGIAYAFNRRASAR